MSRRVWWGDFRTAEFEGLDADSTIAVLPVAAIEQHGPHLPVSTDFSIMNGMLETVFPLLPADLDVRFLPVQAAGKSNEHIQAPGTLTLTPLAVIQSWADLGASVARAGIRKLVIVNSHGGNEEIMGIVARELRVAFRMMAVKTGWLRFGAPENLFAEEEWRLGIHGGEVETSLMLHFRPDLVDMSRAEHFRSATERADGRFEFFKPQGQHGFAWIASDINPAGVAGNAAAATAEKGAATARHQAEGFVRLLKEVREAKLDEWIS
ncbi:MAG: creatininase family protein [Rhizobiaceae bacterium]|nr:creatininase family protein [Rhizobiaceae bacterium]MCV0404849.1 creatininase family protein [Rhizobiaceae bacterium]